MLVESQIQSLQQHLQGVMSYEQQVVSTEHLEKLEFAVKQLETEIKLELGGTFSEEDDRLALLQIAALVNIGVVAYVVNPGSGADQFLEWMLGVFPVLFGIEFMIRVWVRGFANTLWDTKHPDLQAAWWLGAAVISLANLGCVLLVLDSSHSVMPSQDARTLSSLTVLLVITYNKKFGRMTLAFARAAASVMHVSIAILMVVMLYAVASMSLFSTKVIDPATAQPYFDTFSRSLVTMFRMVISTLAPHHAFFG